MTELLTYAFFASRNLPTKTLAPMAWTEYSKPWLNVNDIKIMTWFIIKTVMLHSKVHCIWADRRVTLRLKKSPCANEEALTSSKNQTLRSNMETLDSDLCIFCQSYSSKKPRVVATRNVSDRVINAAKHEV